MPYRWLGCLLLVIFICASPSSARPQHPVVSGGVIDLAGWDLDRDGVIRLDGQWEFYWNTYIDPADLTTGKAVPAPSLAMVPSQFNSIILKGQPLERFGYATYRLRVKGAVPGNVAGLKCPFIMTAFTLWINDRKIDSVGTPGTGPENTVPQRRISISYFTVPAEQFDIVIHVANFSFPVGGIKGPVILGSSRDLQFQRELSTAFNLLTIGSLFIMALYHLGLFLYRRNDYPILFFGLMSLLYSLRSLFVGEIIFSTLFPGVPWEVMLRAEMIDAYLAVLVSAMFYHSLYPDFGNRKLLAAMAVFIALLCTVALFLPTRLFSITLQVFLVLLLVTIIYTLFILIRASVNKSREAMLFAVGLAALSMAAVHDVLVHFSLFMSTHIIQYALFFFIVYQAFVLSRRFSGAMNLVESQKSELYRATLKYQQEIEQREKVQRDLDEYRNQLEAMVMDRTRDLTRANERLQEEIRERARMEEELVKASKIESLGVFAGGIAHDFNNLLTSILGNISLARISDSPLAPLQDAENASLRAKDLTRQLLTFASGGAPIKKVMSVRDLLRDTIQFALSGSSVLAVFSLADNLWNIEVDHGQISQVLHNIVINSIQAMPDGGVISVEAHNVEIAGEKIPLERGNYVRIVMEDTGPGIPQEILDKIFDPYFTTKPHGTGLGLSICYSVITRHNGHIAVDPQGGEGARFVIYLPASARIEETARSRSVEAAPRGQRVLVMDDEESVLRVINTMLKHMGATASLAHNGDEAVSLYLAAKKRGEPFDVVIMDLTIPGAMGGKEAIKKLMEHDENVCAIVSSGYSNDPVMADYRDYGFRGVLAKPFTYEDLVDAMKQVRG